MMNEKMDSWKELFKNEEKIFRKYKADYYYRIQDYWTEKQIQERGIVSFLNLDDLKETLNWNLNGDSKRYQFK